MSELRSRKRQRVAYEDPPTTSNSNARRVHPVVVLDADTPPPTPPVATNKTTARNENSEVDTSLLTDAHIVEANIVEARLAAVGRKISIPVSSGAPTANSDKNRSLPSDSDKNRNILSNSDVPATSETDMPTQTVPHSHTGPCHHEQLLTKLHSHMASMRELVTCMICNHLMYEPFTAACGHTYCYSCIQQWLDRNDTCPDCRTTVNVQPNISYTIREMVRVFMANTTLLPDGETAEEHQVQARQEAETLAGHKYNTDPKVGGLFKGKFAHQQTQTLWDAQDDVVRCGVCTWEMDDGVCPNCGMGAEDDGSIDDSYEDDDDNDDDLDHDLAHADQNAGPYYFRNDQFRRVAPMPPPWMIAQLQAQPGFVTPRNAISHDGNVSLSDEEEESDDSADDDDSIHDFIDERVLPASSDQNDYGSDIEDNLQNLRYNVASDDFDEGEEEPDGDIVDLTQYSDDDDGSPAFTGRRVVSALARSRSRRVIIDSEDEDGDEDDASTVHQARVGSSSRSSSFDDGGFSPLQTEYATGNAGRWTQEDVVNHAGFVRHQGYPVSETEDASDSEDDSGTERGSSLDGAPGEDENDEDDNDEDDIHPTDAASEYHGGHTRYPSVSVSEDDMGDEDEEDYGSI